MKANVAKLLIVAGTLGGLASSMAQTKSSSALPQTDSPLDRSGPRIQFAETTFNFGKLDAGQVVRHDFVFTNIGTATLQIKDVRAGCGCTTAGSWDRLVEPGKTGSIPLQFDSSNMAGTVDKSATVTCNDPSQSNVVLHIKGTLWRPIDVTPMMAVFNVSSEIQTNETKIVRIVSNSDDPVELSDLQCTNRAFQAELKTVRPGKEFELLITAVPPFASNRITAPITLKTSLPKIPTITVSAYVVLSASVIVAPDLITLPTGPLANAMHPEITVRNTGTNSLILSEIGVNAPGVTVRVQEIQPGRLFKLTLDFPAGFHVKPGQDLEVSAKSNHPKFPLIKVPVLQLQPAAPAEAQTLSSPTPGAPANAGQAATAGSRSN